MEAIRVTSTCSTMDAIYAHAKELCDTFLAAKLPGIYAEIKMDLSEQYMKDSEICFRVEIFKKTFCGNKIIQKIAYTIKKEKHLHKLSACLDKLRLKYSVLTAEYSDSDG